MKKYILLLTLLYLFTFSFNAKLKINQNDEPEEDNETEVKDKYCQEELIELNIPEQAIIDSKTNISIQLIVSNHNQINHDLKYLIDVFRNETRAFFKQNCVTSDTLDDVVYVPFYT